MEENKILVVIHLYYLNQWNQISNLINNIKQTFSHNYQIDIYITLPETKFSYNNLIKKFDNKIVVIGTENKGYDLWPFIKVLNIIKLDEYAYVIKIHTKRTMGIKIEHFNKTYLLLNLWRHYLLLFLKKKNLKKCMIEFKNNPKTGMINSKILFDTIYRNSDDLHNKYCLTEAESLLRQINIKPFPQDRITYIAGTMFICRAKLLQPLKELKFKLSDFRKINRNKVNDLPHVLERFLGWLITSQGYKITDCFSTKLDDIIHNTLNSTLLFLYILLYRIPKKIKRFIIRKNIVGDEKYYLLFKTIKIKNKH